MLKIIKILASPMLMAILLVAFAIASAIATFIENDFGTSIAKALIYNAWWFELLMFALAINFLAAIFTRKLYTRKKWSVLLFHVGFVVILFGAAVTRHIGQEGMMHIREGETAKSFVSAENWLKIYLNQELIEKRETNFTTVSANRYKRIIHIDNQRVKVKLNDFIPNAVETVVEHFDGYPVLSLLILDSLGNHSVFVRPKHKVPVGENGIGFLQEGQKHDVELFATDTALLARSVYPVLVRDMPMEIEKVVPVGTWFPLEKRTIYQTGKIQFANRGFWPKAIVKMVASPERDVVGRSVLAFDVEINGVHNEVYVPELEPGSNPIEYNVNGSTIGFIYGKRKVDIPFGIKLNNFILERYPGSDSPSSFTSNVILIDEEHDYKSTFSIYMNNILNYRGFRFYQSSYDPDEQGTYLSVNNDFWGTAITYFGYFILIVGIVWSLFAKGSRFRQLLSKPAAIILLLLAFTLPHVGFSQAIPSTNIQSAREFGELLVQDKGGRIKPMGTLASEVLRKLNRSVKFQGQTPEQIYLGMSSFPEHWQHVPIIKIKNSELKALIGISGDLAAFVDFFDHQAGGSYRLSRLVQDAFAVRPAQRSAMQKDLVKVDEKVNVIYMVFSGQMANIFPVPNHHNNRWINMVDASGLADSSIVSSAANAYADYILTVRKASNSGNWEFVSQKLNTIKDFQLNQGKDIVPSSKKIKAELITTRLNVFKRLIPIYGLVGFVLLVLVFLDLFRTKSWRNILYNVLAILLIFGFIAHSLGIGMRWYIAGRAPLSNSFETMVYIAWAAMFAGFFFYKRSRVVIPATALLSTLTLFVAHLSWMDPEVTNLVPVLKSYWLTIHVAVITASYGFFGLAAILGLFNLSLFALKSKDNKEMIDKQISNITNINEINLTLGLHLLTIGSFLGAVWANESWGRYWGWDPKETWALITIIVYAFILHMRLIPAFKTNFTFNFGAVIGIGSVLMTYFGVNYYLSGLHSYAGGDAVPIPTWLYFIVAAIFSLSFLAWYNNRIVESET